LPPPLGTTPDDGCAVSPVTMPEVVAGQVWPEIPAAMSRVAADVPYPFCRANGSAGGIGALLLGRSAERVRNFFSIVFRL